MIISDRKWPAYLICIIIALWAIVVPARSGVGSDLSEQDSQPSQEKRAEKENTEKKTGNILLFKKLVIPAKIPERYDLKSSASPKVLSPLGSADKNEPRAEK